MNGTVSIGPSVVSLAEAQAYIRVENGEEEALLAGFLRSATAACEAFVGSQLVEREFLVRLDAAPYWQKLGVHPVRSIVEVAAVQPDGTRRALTALEYGVDIDASGNGLVRVSTGAHGVVEVRGNAGMARDANGVPEPIRQGILRLTSHFFTHRDTDTEPPLAVTALWRPYRRVRL